MGGRKRERLTEAVEAALKGADIFALGRISKGGVMASAHLVTSLIHSQYGARCILGDASPAQMEGLETLSLSLVNATQTWSSKFQLQ